MASSALALPDIEAARLPVAYEAAKVALANCARVDECREWADRMEALASYARQSEDETLLKHARRIMVRAIDRCGEILREIEPARGNNQYTSEDWVGTYPIQYSVTKGIYATGHEANLSTGQIKTALRVNAVPRELFEEMVESDNPPTVTQLAQLGTKRRPEPIVIDDYLKGRDPDDFHQAGLLIGVLDYVNEHVPPLNLEAAVRGLNNREFEETLVRLATAQHWLKEVQDALFAR